MSKPLHQVSLLCLVLACACGAEDPGASGEGNLGAAGAAGAGPAVDEGALLPWSAGNRWIYRVTEGTAVSEKTTTVGPEEEVGGTGPSAAERAHKVVTTNLDGADETVSWQAALGDKVVRYREQSFTAATLVLELEEYWTPYKLHIDGSAEHTTAGARWLEEYSETKIQYISGTPSTPTTSPQIDEWQVESVGTSVTVPAGTFTAKVLKKLPTGKRYWYVPGVGKVKEEGAGRTEELVSYEVQP